MCYKRVCPCVPSVKLGPLELLKGERTVICSEINIVFYNSLFDLRKSILQYCKSIAIRIAYLLVAPLEYAL